MGMLRWLPVLLAVSLFACSGVPDVNSTDEELSKAPMENFHKVRAGLYRGGHPSTAGVAFLKKIGIKTIVDLEIGDFIEATPWAISGELSDAKAQNIKVLRYPMSAFELAASSDFDHKIDTIMSKLDDTSLMPIYVHCAHGQDRTGLVIGLERVIDEGWTPKAAHAEMLKLGFHTELLGLNHYFEEKTGFED
jgi:protein tyrosine/serine phosphatase